MEKFITIRGLDFKCIDDGTIFIYHEGDIRGLSKNPRWKKIGGKTSGGYLSCHTSQGLIKSHRIIAAAFLGLDIENKSLEVDHIDGNRSNNNVSNLRVVTHTQNCMNYNGKEVKGIYETEYGWRAQINHNKKQIAKRFKTLEEAKAWRIEKEIEFGYLHTSCL